MRISDWSSDVCSSDLMNDQNELKNMGLKATFPRLKILDIFRRADLRHQSAEDVYRTLVAEDVDIGLATVYRVLTQFEQAGILVRSQFDGVDRRRVVEGKSVSVGVELGGGEISK